MFYALYCCPSFADIVMCAELSFTIVIHFMVSIPPTFSMTLVIILTSMLEENVESVEEEALTEEAEDPEEGEVTGAH